MLRICTQTCDVVVFFVCGCVVCVVFGEGLGWGARVELSVYSRCPSIAKRNMYTLNTRPNGISFSWFSIGRVACWRVCADDGIYAMARFGDSDILRINSVRYEHEITFKQCKCFTTDWISCWQKHAVSYCLKFGRYATVISLLKRFAQNTPIAVVLQRENQSHRNKLMAVMLYALNKHTHTPIYPMPDHRISAHRFKISITKS